MKLGLRAKLSAAFVLAALFIFLLFGVLANVILDRQFKEYTVNKEEQAIGDTVGLLKNQYQAWGGKWNLTGIENIGVNAMGQGLIIRVRDKDNAIVWDARVHNNGMCTAILEDMARNMQGYYRSFQGGYEEKSFPLVSGGETVGNVDVGYYGPFFYSDVDIAFLKTLNNLLLIAAVVSFVLCLLFGAYMSSRLAKPIRRVIDATGRIAGGDFECRITEKTDTKEIVELTDSVNSLANTLGKQELLRKRLTSDVAHELRTPLATLQSHMEAMIDGVWEPEPARLISCHEEILRLSGLVGELEQLSRYEGENLVLHMEKVELSGLLQGVMSDFAGAFDKKVITFSLDAPEHWIEGDRDKLKQLFINLISNAIKYTPDGGRIEVSLKSAQGDAVVSVKDSGIGISEEDLPHIFERFYRTDRSRSRETGGTGIGLTISKAIAEAHNGTITVKSEPNRGSTFTVTLPDRQES
jgi:two-component system sensor histidine kinase BaeS